MCGILGYVGNKNNCVRVLIDGLELLEYRGYDSAGIAFVNNNKINITKEVGSIANLKQKVNFNLESYLGIGHTRWATHGKASVKNSHPHKVGKFTIVHNGIIENYNEIKEKLIKEGYNFISDTDTEVLCALIDKSYKKEKEILKVIEKVKEKIIGSYAVGIICDDDLETLYYMKSKSPLVIGVGESTNYIASDVPTILNKTKNYIELKDGDYGKITKDTIENYSNGKKQKLKIEEFEFDLSDISKNGYETYMLKEIHEQKEVFKKTVEPYLKDGIEELSKKMPSFDKYKKIRIVSCGSATHAAYVGKEMLEKYADMKTTVETASEFRYKNPFLEKDELVIAISQSGETADTLEAVKLAKKYGNDVLGIINAKGSSIAREASLVLYTEAGKEIAVATTKAYSSQVALLSLIALNISYKKKILKDEDIKIIMKDIKKIPNYIEELLSVNYKSLAKKLYKHSDIFFIGRKVDYALAMEGSLKLKEISYTHSEAYAAGELKHGTISLIENKTPVISIVTDSDIALKTISNIKEVKAREAYVIYITNRKDEVNNEFFDDRIIIPKVHPLFEPILAIIPLQLISYEVAKLKKCSIDKPKNLAKSVTVE